MKSYKFEICIVVFFLLIMGINAYNYINEAILSQFYPIKGLNAFSFWYYVRAFNIGEIILFLSPIFIMIIATNWFYSELSSGIYKNIILKIGYKKYMLMNILKAYIKGGLLIPVISILVFLIGLFLFSDKIIYLDGGNLAVTSLPYGLSDSPYMYIIGILIFNIIYSLIIVNIVLIVQTRIRKSYIILISSFAILMALNYGIYLIVFVIAMLMKSSNLLNIAEAISIYQGYISDVNMIITFISLIVWLTISSVIVYIIYRKKQRIFDNYG